MIKRPTRRASNNAAVEPMTSAAGPASSCATATPVTTSASTSTYTSTTDAALTRTGGTIAGTQAANLDLHTKILTLLASQ